MHAITNILLDGARLKGDLQKAISFHAEHSSLYKGKSEESLLEVAPHLFSVSASNGLFAWYCERGWGQAWGVLIVTAAPFNELFRHLRQFLIVKTEEGQELYFRFYDPRVLRSFLPTCDIEQLKDLFGPVKKYICEDENEEFALTFAYENGGLKIERFPKEVILKTDMLELMNE